MPGQYVPNAPSGPVSGSGESQGRPYDEGMAKRTYDQYCGLARALDIVGERWTLLLVRELLIGPARYTDLLEALPGIGTNLLAARLKDLEALGVIKRVPQPQPAGAFHYEIAPLGEELRPAVVNLARWGLQLLGAPTPRMAVSATWGFLALQSMVQDAPARDVGEAYEFRVDDSVFHVITGPGDVAVGKGPVEAPSVVLETDAATFVAVGSGHESPVAAARDGRVKVTGDSEAFARCCELLGLALSA